MCRGFIKAEESVPNAARLPDLLATRFVVLIGKLFAAEARSVKWAPKRRQRQRARYSARVLSIIERMLVEHLPDIVPSSLLGKALQYMSKQWPKTVRYVENGNWPISHTLCENTIRSFVVGRKGWLFSDTVAGAQASANMYSLVETCKAIGIETFHYVVWLFTRLPLAATADDYAISCVGACLPSSTSDAGVKRPHIEKQWPALDSRSRRARLWSKRGCNRDSSRVPRVRCVGGSNVQLRPALAMRPFRYADRSASYPARLSRISHG